MDDATGLDEAYATDEGTYTAGKSLYVAGTKSVGDAIDDLGIPLGLTNMSARYRDSALVLNANPQITRVVGHSLGGAVALQLQKENPALDAVTYGAPVVSLPRGGSSERFRQYVDPVAALDFGATTSVPQQLNVHSYSLLAKNRRDPGPSFVSREIR